MYNISKMDSLSIEHIVTGAFELSPTDNMGGMIHSDHFLRDPFSAAIMLMTPLVYLGKITQEECDQIVGYYKCVFDYPEENLTDEVFKKYKDVLRDLAKKYK